MNDLILIVCYMGKLPGYFSMFIDSCAWNSKIDFLIVTDDFIDAENFPQNIQVVNKGIDDIEKLIKSRISTSAKLERPYKLCDYKPAYGVLFEEYIKQYNFWGHCDIDLIWGDLEHTVLPLLAQNKDRYFKYGHLTLYKNTPEVAEFYKKDYLIFDKTIQQDYNLTFNPYDNYLIVKINMILRQLYEIDKNLILNVKFEYDSNYQININVTEWNSVYAISFTFDSVLAEYLGFDANDEFMCENDYCSTSCNTKYNSYLFLSSKSYA